jgi:hypothetical protein
MRAQPKFWIPAVCAAGLALLHQLVLWLQLGNEWRRWVLHEPAFSLFLIVVFPVALGALVTAASTPFVTFWKKSHWSKGLVALLMVMIAILVIQDINRRPFHPYLVSRATGMVDFDRALRRALKEGADRGLALFEMERLGSFEAALGGSSRLEAIEAHVKELKARHSVPSSPNFQSDVIDLYFESFSRSLACGTSGCAALRRFIPTCSSTSSQARLPYSPC